LAAALFALLASVAVPAMMDLLFQTSAATIPPTTIAFVIDQIVQSVVQALAELWLVRLRLLAGLGLIAGLFLVAAGFILNWMMAEQPVAESGYY
jgi:hypothetical protein